MSDNQLDPKLAKAEAAAEKAKAKSLRPWFQKKRFIIPIALVTVFALSSALNSGNGGQTSSQGSSSSSDDTESVEPETATEYANETVSQENARKSAESYLAYSSFSRSGLIGQLEYEEFSNADAVYAVDILNVDWNAQAKGSAESYLNSSAFSRSGLIGQLEYEGFSTEEATYGVDAVNPDWNEQAAKSAESYLNSSSFSRQGLIDQLIYEGFTPEQATYGVDQTGL